MDDFNLTSFLSGGNNDPEQPKETSTPAAPAVQNAGSGSDFDLTKFIGSGPQKTAKNDDYGILDRQRDTVIAETGEDIGKGEALARNLIPFVGDEGKSSRSAELIQLQKLYDGSAMKDITDRREKGLRGDDAAGDRKNRNMVFDAINQSSSIGNSGFGAALAQIQHARAQERKTPEETYFDQLDNVAKNAGINPETRKKLRESSTTVDEFAEKLRGAAEGELKAYATRRKEAQARLKENEPGAMATIINGLITNTGYQGKYLVGGMSGGLSLVGVAAQSAEQRALDLQTKDYDVDEEGNLVVIHNDDSAGKAAVKGIAGGVAEVAVEQFLEKTLGLGKHIPGVGKYLGKASDAVSGVFRKVAGAAGAKLSKNAAGKWLVGAAQNFGKYQQYTGVNGLPMEMLEEHVQDFADDVLGFNVKGRDQGTLGSDAKDWWHNKFWNAEHNKDLFLGLIGTMALQGVYAGTKAHHDIKKWRQNPAGFLKTVLDEKTVDKLSDAEVAHLYKLVSSPGFTKDKVDRFLGHVQGRTEMANALMELREANTPFFDTDKNAVDDAVKTGSVKSQFVPPTTDVTGGKRLDWQPFVWNDGTKTMRIFDPNTGIAIDKIGTGNKFCVTNRDGLRIVVDGETDGDASARALSVADKMSIHNQLLDAKRPAKEEYIKKRIAETAQNGKFLLVKNAADLDKQFPELKKSPEYSPDNPALKLGDGRIVLVTDNLKSAQEVNRMILHEAAIHSGLDKKFTTEQKRQFLRNIKDPSIERYKERVNALREARGLAPYDWDSDVGVEEAFAHVWDRRRANPLLSQKINHFIREVGRSVHLPVSYNADDLEVMVEGLQRSIREPGGKLDESKFDTTNAADSIPYNEAQRDFSGDVADVSKPSGSTEGGIAVRSMQRNDRIKAAHPHLWEYAMRQSGGDEDAAAEYVSDRLEDEGRRGVSGEMDHAHHALMVAEKLENGEDLSADDMEILDEHGFTGQVLYKDYGYRRQKNGSWKLVGRKDNAAHPELAPKSEPKKPVITAKVEENGPDFPVTAVPVTVKKSNRQAKAEFEKKFVDRLATKGGYIQRIPASSIKTGDGRIVQFKEDADPRTGIVPGNELEGEYDETTAGLPVVMRFEDGHYETVTGRHRINLAQRNGIDINVMVLEHGEDGKPGTFSVADAEAIDAKANIKDGKGTIKDYIKFFRHAKMTKAEAEREGLLGKKTQGRKAFALYNDATPELTAAVDFDGTAENDDRTITPEQAGIIAMNAPKDGHKLNGAVQRSMRDYCVKHPKANGDRLARLTQAKAHQLIQAEKDGQLKENGDGQMFLFADMAADVAATDKLDEIENYKEKRSAEYKKVANSLRDAKNSKGRLQISPEFAQELDLIDTETGDVTTDKKRLEAAAQEALGKAFMWTRMELPADMQDEMERALKLGKYADQQDLPVQNEPAGDLKLPRPKPKSDDDVIPHGMKTRIGIIKEDVAARIADIDPDIKIKGIAIHGSRIRGDHRKDSDLDAVVEFDGDWSEDALFNALHDNDILTIDGVKVDINPIRADKSGTLKDYMIRSRQHDLERQMDKNAVGVSDKPTQKPATVKKPIPQQTIDNFLSNIAALDRAKAAAEKHVVTYGNGSKATLAKMIEDGMATFYPDRGLLKSDKGPHVVTIGMEQFIPTKEEIPYLAMLQKAKDNLDDTPDEFEDEDEDRGTKEAEKPTTTAPEKPQNGLSGVDLGDIGNEFDNLGNDMWFSRELEDGHTEEEIQAHNLAIGVKMVKLFASKGYTRFEDFAKTFAARIPDAYKRSRDYIPGMWLTARIMGTQGIEEITEKGALEVLKAVDHALSAPTIAGSAANSSPTASAEPTQATTPPAHGTRGEAISAAADEVLALIDKGEKFDQKRLVEIVGRHLGGSIAEGTFDTKAATDILELAVNRYMKNKGSLFDPSANASANQAVTVINRIRKILETIPTQTVRSEKMVKFQQFSTPPHEAFVAAWVANVTDKDTSLEPSAGIGGIAVFSKIAGANVIVNEIDTEGRAPILAQLGLSPKVYSFNAENLWTYFYPLVGKGEVKRPTVVVMNPPFSNSATTHVKDTIGIGGKHIEQALQMLAPGGRLVAIVGHGMAHDADSAKVRDWWKRIGEKYQIRADVTVNGDEYKKYGTTYDNNLIVIDKVAPDNTKTPVYGKIQSIDELPAMLEGVRNDRPAVKHDQDVKRPGAKQGGSGSYAEDGRGPKSNPLGRPRPDNGKAGNGKPGSGSSVRLPGRNGQSGNVTGSDEVDNGSVRGGQRENVGGNVGNRNDASRPDGNSGRGPDSDGAVQPGLTEQTAQKNEVAKEVGNGTFSKYVPPIVFPNAKKHPSDLVEPTAMAIVKQPDATYKLVLPQKVIDLGILSDAQLVQVQYACQAFERILSNGTRHGYFIGDGTGVGKGREIVGIMMEQWLRGRRKMVWVSEKESLGSDARRDLYNFGLGDALYQMDSDGRLKHPEYPKRTKDEGPMPPPKIASIVRGGMQRKLDQMNEGILFSWYSNLRSGFGGVDQQTGRIVSTSKTGKKCRLQQIIDWFGKDYDGLIVFDEAHNAANTGISEEKDEGGFSGGKDASKQAEAVMALQKALPNARILYVSATGATEVSNLAYAERMGLWGEGTAFESKEKFVGAMSKDISLMEFLSRDMKADGSYLARSLSYDGIVNRRIAHELTPDQVARFNKISDAWRIVLENFNRGLQVTGGANNKDARRVISAFWGAHQRFFNTLLNSMMLPSVFKDAQKYLDKGESVVFQLVSTGEAAQTEAMNAEKALAAEEGRAPDFDSIDTSPRGTLIQFVRQYFPVKQYEPQEEEPGKIRWVEKPLDNPEAIEIRERLIRQLSMMKMEQAPLDAILEEFGYDNVAEGSGRTGRLEMRDDGHGNLVRKFVRRSKENEGKVEVSEFNSGKRHVLVFSKAMGTGASFHADRNFKNQTKRHHYLLEAGFGTFAAVQGLGRTHRSNEAVPPEYILCSTALKGHLRFMTSVARRMQQLGSLTGGDRSSAGSGIFSESDNLENKYAQTAVKMVFKDAFKNDKPLFERMCSDLGLFKYMQDSETKEYKLVNSLVEKNGALRKDEELPDVKTFLNRLLGCKTQTQNEYFDMFHERMTKIIDQAIADGTYSPGIRKLQGVTISEKSRTELWKDPTRKTEIVEVDVGEKNTSKIGFHDAFSKLSRTGTPQFAIRDSDGSAVMYVYTGIIDPTSQKEKIVYVTPSGKTASVLDGYIKLSGEKKNFTDLREVEASALWDKQFAETPDTVHSSKYFIDGSILPIFDRLGVDNPNAWRVTTTEGEKKDFLGMQVDANKVKDILRRFGKSVGSVTLGPQDVMNRILREGKRVELQNGWVLRRSNRATGAEIQIDNVYEDADIDALESNPYVHSRVNGRTSMFFVNQNIEDFTKFMDRYPAVPEEGGLGTVGVGSENKYVNMSREQQRVELANIIDGWQGVRADADYDPANEKPWMESLNQLISVMPNDELKRASYDFQQYDKKVVSDPVYLLRSAIRKELKSRGEVVNEVETPELWYSRDLEDDDTSSVAIHEVNAWRLARGLPEMKKHRPTSVEAIVRAGKTMASNRDEMERFIEVSARTPQNWTATEVNAVAQRRIQLEEDYDEKTRLINEAEMNGNREEAQRIREARDLTQDMLDTMDRAINKAKREWGLAGLARRFLLNRNGSFVRFSGELQSFAGRKLTEEEETGARMLWDAYREAQGKLDEETVRKTSELLKDIVRRHMATEEQQHRIGRGKTLKQIEDEYIYALDHIRVHANRAGGVLLGLPDGRKWIDALRRYHMAAALETGRKLTVDEMLAAIHADIDGMIRADDHDIMQLITGHGNTYEADNSELEKAMREQRALMNEYQKWEDMMTEGHLPDKTGLIRDEPTQTLRDAQKITRDLMREFMEQHPELMQMDASKRLKTVQDSLMKRWRNEIEDLQKAIDDGEKIMRAKNVMTYTPEMQELRRRLEEKRREYHEMFPPEPLTHEEKVSRALRVLQRKLAALQEKKAALEKATTDAERENILRKSRGAKLEDESLEAVRDQIADLQEDIQDLHDLHFPAGTVDEFMAMVRRRKNALAKNIQRIETQLNNRDFAPQKREPSALAKRVAADPAVMEAVKLRNAASQRLMQERERFRRSVLPYNAGRALDWFDALTSAPRVFRTMLDLSATMTQGAALFTSHPVLGWQALVDSVKSFYSADNTDAIMAALYVDPDYTEFQEMGGRVYNVSNLDEKTLPEEFRGISQKVFTIRGKQYGIDDIPGVKASERSFGVFLNAINLGVYKAIKASGGWGPTGPSETQKKDIALSLNVASGYGYDNKGGRGAWDKVMSAALWAPRFAVSGFKMAVGWNILAPQWTGLTTERSYRDRMVSSKVAAQQYVRQVASMAAWTLLATLLMGRKDPEWLDEMLNPLSSNFLNVRVGNTNLNFFGPIKQWWTFMARMLTGKTMGRDGVVKNADQLQVAGRFARGKLSPLAGVAMDILDGKTFIGEKLVWDRSAESAREKNGWKHVAASVGIPLSAGDLADAFKENTLANALLLTPFVVAGAGKSTIAPEGDDAYNRKVNPYKALAKDYKAAMKEGRWDDVKRLRAENPILLRYSLIESRLKAVQDAKKQIRYMEKAGRTPSESLLKRYDLSQQAVLDAIEQARK